MHRKLLKQAMSVTPVLALPDFALPFVIETEVCDDGLGAVLMQQGRPLAYLSKVVGLKTNTSLFMRRSF